jgi:electron transport complex protein RnfG
VRDILKLGLVLMVIAAVSGGSLAYVHKVTSAVIEERKAKEVAQSMKAVLPSAEDFRQLDEDELAPVRTDPKFAGVKTVYTGSTGGQVDGVVAMVETSGYGGKVGLLIGIDSRLGVSGIQVLSQSETPGLGTNITKPEFLSQFVGRGAGGALAVSKEGGEIQAVTGATISSKAVVAGVNVVRELAIALDVAGGAKR